MLQIDDGQGCSLKHHQLENQHSWQLCPAASRQLVVKQLMSTNEHIVYLNMAVLSDVNKGSNEHGCCMVQCVWAWMQ